MGFLLSKLLPLFVYPLGLGLLLQLAGLGAAARGQRVWGLGLGGAGIGLIWLFAMPFTSRQLIWGLEERAAALTPAPIPTADAVLVLGGLGFLGLGLPETIPEWGGDLQQALTALPTGIWWTALYPGVAMFVLVLGLSFLGEGLESWLSGSGSSGRSQS